MDSDAAAYIDAIDPQFRPLFDRVHGLIVSAYPDAVVTISYGIPTYVVAKNRLHIGVWQHGVSIYGWTQEAADGLLAAHPTLRTGKGTIKMTDAMAAQVSDDELLALIHATLRP